MAVLQVVPLFLYFSLPPAAVELIVVVIMPLAFLRRLIAPVDELPDNEMTRWVGERRSSTCIPWRRLTANATFVHFPRRCLAGKPFSFLALHLPTLPLAALRYQLLRFDDLDEEHHPNS